MIHDLAYLSSGSDPPALTHSVVLEHLDGAFHPRLGATAAANAASLLYRRGCHCPSARRRRTLASRAHRHSAELRCLRPTVRQASVATVNARVPEDLESTAGPDEDRASGAADRPAGATHMVQRAPEFSWCYAPGR
jgi:hypothetical protein